MTGDRRRRRVVFTVILAIIPLLALEGGARFWESMQPPDPRAEIQDARARLLGNVTDQGRADPSFFVAEGGVLGIRDLYSSAERCYPFHCADIVVAKPPTEYRIACFGGSTTNGIDLLTPAGPRGVGRERSWGDQQPFCEHVRDRLQAAWPDRQVTAHNFGGDGFDSEALLPVAREAADRTAWDLWILYMGHNEFIYSTGLVEPIEGAAEAVGLAASAARGLALYRAMVRAYRAVWPASGSRRAYSSAIFRTTARHASEYDRVLTAFESRLREFAKAADEAGASLVLSELVSNVVGITDDELFICFNAGTGHDQILSVLADFEAAIAVEERDGCAAAVSSYERLARREPAFTAPLHRLSACLAKTGDRDGALLISNRAKVEHLFPDVATPRLIGIIKSVADDTGAVFVPQAADFDGIYRRDPEQHTRLFIDDVHPTDRGHRIIADNISRAVLRSFVNRSQ